MVLDSTVPRVPDGEGAGPAEVRLRLVLVVKDPAEADALADGLAANFAMDVVPVATVDGARMALVAGSYHVVVVEGRFGLAWLEGLDPRPGVVVLGPLRRGTPPEGEFLVEDWPEPVWRLAQVIRRAATGG